jgi:hypothetical protein
MINNVHFMIWVLLGLNVVALFSATVFVGNILREIRWVFGKVYDVEQKLLEVEQDLKHIRAETSYIASKADQLRGHFVQAVDHD